MRENENADVAVLSPPDETAPVAVLSSPDETVEQSPNTSDAPPVQREAIDLRIIRSLQDRNGEDRAKHGGLVMKRHTSAISFGEDTFDLEAHKKEAAAFSRKKAREKRVRRQVLIGKIMLGVATVIIFFMLFLVARELGIFNFR